jgi:hypothetical protein
MTTTNHKRSFTHVSPLTGNITIRYYHECLHCRKEYTSSRERGLSGWCSHRCETLGLAEAYKRGEL